MPEVCRQYDCFWREHDALSESWRPDRVGIVVTEGGSVIIGYRLLPVVLFQEDSTAKAFSEAGQDSAAWELLDHFVARGFAVMIIRGLEARIEFDRDRWPGISPQEIEAALRCELSRDAAELKRLGAVGDDYLPLQVPSPAGRGLGCG